MTKAQEEANASFDTNEKRKSAEQRQLAKIIHDYAWQFPLKEHGNRQQRMQDGRRCLRLHGPSAVQAL